MYTYASSGNANLNKTISKELGIYKNKDKREKNIIKNIKANQA